MLVGHKKQKEFLEKKAELDQLSHAYLFSGENAIGKKLFAIEFAKSVNCHEENSPCQKCFNCQAIERGNFPDLMIISEANKKDLPTQAGEKFVPPQRDPAKGGGDGGEIKIGQIREVQNFLSYKSYYGSFKIVVVDDAEKMNQEAQSCFLKTLEEPKGKTLLLLISSKPDMLLETIISRCQNIKFSKPKNLPVNLDRQEKEQKILDDLISAISSSFSEKFKYVKAIDFEKQNASDILSVLQRYLRHLLMVKLGTEKGQGKDDNFEKYTIGELKKILNLAEDISKKLTFTNANPKLALEILLMEF